MALDHSCGSTGSPIHIQFGSSLGREQCARTERRAPPCLRGHLCAAEDPYSDQAASLWFHQKSFAHRVVQIIRIPTMYFYNTSMHKWSSLSCTCYCLTSEFADWNYNSVKLTCLTRQTVSEATKKSASMSCLDESCEHPLVFNTHTFTSAMKRNDEWRGNGRCHPQHHTLCVIALTALIWWMKHWLSVHLLSCQIFQYLIFSFSISGGKFKHMIHNIYKRQGLRHIKRIHHDKR